MTPRRLPLSACLAILLVPAALVAHQQAPRLRILSPQDGSMVSGPMVLSAEIVPAPTEPVQVRFYADQSLVCTVDRPPYQCTWDAGVGIRRHQIRVVAQIEGGRPLADSVTTTATYSDNVNVDMVHIPVTVTDGGRYVTGLTKEAFRLYEDGVAQRISNCLSGDAQLELLVAVDVSGSMTAAMPQLKAAVKQFLKALRPNDRVSGIAFNDNPMTLWRPESDLQARLKAVDLLEPWGSTSLYDVLVRSLDMMGTGLVRRSVVVFTDGDDTSSHLSRQELDEHAERSDASLFLIGQGRGVEATELKEVLKHLAAVSGGRPFFPDRMEKLPDVFSEIVQELSHQYVLAYPPPTADYNPHKLTVKTANGKWKVRFKQSRRRSPPGKRQP